MGYFRPGKINTHDHLYLFPGWHTIKLLPRKVLIFLQFITAGIGIKFLLIFVTVFVRQLTDIRVIYS